MMFQKGNMAFFIAFILIGALLGSALGSLLVNMVPSLAFLTKNLTKPVGFTFDVITFGLNINLFSIIGIILGIVLFRKV
jgi:predicted membrane chloride channel (bestrophin family)